MTMLPEGFRVDVKLFVTSDVTGLQACITMKNLPAMTILDEGAAARVIKTLPDAETWRPMTKAEIAEYIAENEDEQED